MAQYSSVAFARRFPHLDEYCGETVLSAVEFTSATYFLLRRMDTRTVSSLLQITPAEIMKKSLVKEKVLFELEAFLRKLNNSWNLEEVVLSDEPVLTGGSHQIVCVAEEHSGRRSSKTDNEILANLKFSERFNVPTVQLCMPLYSVDALSTQIKNQLSRLKILTVGNLLDQSESSLRTYYGFSAHTVGRILRWLTEIHVGVPTVHPRAAVLKMRIPAIFSINRDNILRGEFSFADEQVLSAAERETLELYKRAIADTGIEFAQLCNTSSSELKTTMATLREHLVKKPYIEEIEKELSKIPRYRVKQVASHYIKAYTIDDGLRKILRSTFCEDEATLEYIRKSMLMLDERHIQIVTEFISWCSFDIISEIDMLLQSTFGDNRRDRNVVELRSAKKPLQYVGDIEEITRERVRQIEKKSCRIFHKLQSQRRILSKISADRNGDMVITPAEVKLYAGDNTELLLYLLKAFPSEDYIYDTKLDVFVIGDDSLSERVVAYVEQLPEVINIDRLASLLVEAEETKFIPAEILEKGIYEAYKLTGGVYHRTRLTREVVYSSILQEFYPDGLHAYDQAELNRFREHIKTRYGEIKVPENNRALSAGIAVVSILCGRGRYKAKQREYIPVELAKRIYDYIESNESPVIMLNTLISIFEDDLLAVGVDNKYYLQGILHELYSSEFTFRRDYISKDDSITSIYSSITDFIEASVYPISKRELQNKFPGITEVVINFAISDPEILNFFGLYIHGKYLNISAEEKVQLSAMMEHMLSDGKAHHIKELFDEINREMPSVLSRNFATVSFSAYSLIEYVFRDRYQYSRPYIAHVGIDIGRPAECLHELIYDSEEFALADIQEYCKDNHYQIQSILNYVNACNDKYLFADKTTMISIEKTGITSEVALFIQDEICKEIDGTVPIAKLNCITSFPRIRIPWTEWLIYSVVLKWSTLLEVAPSSNQFRQSKALVSPVGQMECNIDSIDLATGVIVAPDNLDDMDSLLMDIIDIDFLEDDL